MPVPLERDQEFLLCTQRICCTQRKHILYLNYPQCLLSKCVMAGLRQRQA